MPGAAAASTNRCRARIRSPRASSRARTRSRAASCATRGHRHRDDLAQLQQPRQVQGVTGIGLHPIPGGPLQLRTARPPDNPDPRPAGPRQPEPGRPGLIDHRHRTRQPASHPRISPCSGSQPLRRTTHRSHHPTRTPRPIGRAHPDQHSYADVLTGASYICGSTGQDPIPVGNPRPHVARPQPVTPYRLGVCVTHRSSPSVCVVR